jgi:hypothetical protein
MVLDGIELVVGVGDFQARVNEGAKRAAHAPGALHVRRHMERALCDFISN